jgi:predicted small lipoprotein YifL
MDDPSLSPRHARRACRLFLCLAGLLALAGCGVPATTPYRPAQTPGDTGYQEQRIESNRYRVTFTGNTVTAREAVENFMLLRIAELTLAQGYDYFVLDNQDTESQTYYLQSMSDYGPLDPFYGCTWPRSGFSVSTSMPVTHYKAQAYVVLFKGEKPPFELKAFDARDVKASLAPLVPAPPATP